MEHIPEDKLKEIFEKSQEYVDKVLGKYAFYLFQTKGMPVECSIDEFKKHFDMLKLTNREMMMICGNLDKKYNLLTEDERKFIL